MKTIQIIGYFIFIVGSAFSQNSGGPDTYGYTWYNSNHAQGPVFNWIDITSSGIQITGLSDDNSVAFISMAQPFHYYWSDYTQIKIGSNGWLSFDNVGNIAHCFPVIPTSAGAGDNYLAPFMSDLIFGAAIPSEAWYYDDLVNDRFIVSYINVPWWSVNSPGYVGSNTFQVILSRSDSSITYQYQTVDPSNFNDQATCDADLEIGLENLTGNIGLEVYNDVIPANNLAVLFDYPGNVTFQVIDPAPSWLQNSESKGTFVSSAQPFSKNVAIENFGNTDVTADTYVITELLDMNSVVIWASSDTISSLSAGQSQTISYSNIGPIAAGQYYFRTTTSNSSDLNNGNNILVSEIEVLDVSTNPILMSYATQGLPSGNVSWSGGGGAGTFMVPPSYPAIIDSVSMFIVNTQASSDYNVYIIDDDGPNNSPGTILSSQVVTNGTFTLDSWVVSVLPSPITITSGGFYIGWDAPTANSIALGTETIGPISRNSLEYIGAWEEYRENNSTELLINAYISSSCSSLSANIDSITDVSCFGGSNGYIYVTTFGTQGNVNYDWSAGGGTNEDPGGLTAGTYDLVYTDSLGCNNSLSAVVDEPNILAISETVINENTGGDGSINLTITGGTPPYNYLWTNAATAENISGLVAGSYSCTITDANSCSTQATILVGSPSGIINNSTEKDIKLIPNPNNGLFIIKSEKSINLINHIVIINTIGQNVYTRTVKNADFLEVNTNLNPGIYFVHISTESGSVVRRIVIE